MFTHGVLDYSVGREFADAVRAFAMIESGENTQAGGDGGRAFGLLQMHPATFKRYYGCHMRFAPALNDTWEDAQIKCCAAFLAVHRWGEASQDQRDLIVQAWNIGEAGVFVDGKRNPEYLARWLEAYEKIGGLKPREAVQA
jgi:hypothetical protein